MILGVMHLSFLKKKKKYSKPKPLLSTATQVKDIRITNSYTSFKLVNMDINI